ncbi:hypothetical protein NQ318_010314 [Aromia moschata]|uniref:Uncharacterized protein n=1 Tax=Aromia moschata TaxID=1265417 RepID=A0AAV8XIJ7_9CUCU|nr:hypothetical protein NQ318_010314 [Aromia moschata]
MDLIVHSNIHSVIFSFIETCSLKIPVAYRVVFNTPKSLHCDLNGSPSTPQKPTPCRNLNSQDFDGNFRVLQDGLRRTLSGSGNVSGNAGLGTNESINRIF